ncbi:MAG: hypothetical protein ACRDUX_38860, partial [Mycobacterium sp.]
CAGIVPDERDPQLDHRPDYFASFDRWLEQLEAHIPNHATRSAVLTTLDEDGRQVDVRRLVARHRLSRAAARLVRLLVRFGDEGGPVHSFGSICIAEILPSTAKRAARVTTSLYATRRGTQVDYWWADTADGFGALGTRDQPLTLHEAVVMVERVVIAQATYGAIDGGDRSAYTPGRAAQLQIRSTFYPQLEVRFRSRAPRGVRRRDGRDPRSA